MDMLRLSVYVVVIVSVICFPAYAKSPADTKLYIAAALFNSRETRFNIEFVKQIENLKYKTIFPQRDGFEYKFLAKTTEKFLPPDKIAQSVRDLIYLLDMGVFIPESDIVIANLDEPLDEGVIVEMTYAHLMGKPVIGFRTDVRTPFGLDQGLGGMHAFVALQCDYLIIQHPSSANATEADLSIKKLAQQIDRTIQSAAFTKITKAPEDAFANPKAARVIQLARKIIGDPSKIHSDEGLNAAVKRLIANKQVIQPVRV